MDDRPHKAHRPSQSGAKAEKKAKAKGGKEKQKGFNEKVRIVLVSEPYLVLTTAASTMVHHITGFRRKVRSKS